MQDVVHLRRNERRRKRQPAGERLGEAHDIGLETDRFSAVEKARTTEARLYLITYEHHVVLRGELVECARKLPGHHPQAAFALYHLHNDAGEAFVEDVLEHVGVVERCHLDTGNQGLELRAVLRIGRDRERTHRAAVEAVGECEKPVMLGPLRCARVEPGILQRRFVGLSAAVAEMHRGKPLPVRARRGGDERPS